MGRGQRALHYQLYALGPLVMLAELGEANGMDMYGMRDGAIHRLVRFNIDAMKDPSIIVKRTGVAQDTAAPFSGLEIGWAVPYVQRFPNAQLSAWIAKAPWVRFWQWGGTPPEVGSLQTSEKASHKTFQAYLRYRVEVALNSEFPADHRESAGFWGTWCVQGNLDMHASISDKGNFILLDNGIGSTSTGVPIGSMQMQAAGWGSVVGKLTADKSQIDWSNGTYWSRCPSSRTPSPVDLSGRWYADGGVRPSFIQQNGDQISISQGKGCRALGQVDGTGHLTTEWSGKRIDGAVTADGNHINWDNLTYWTRSKVYESWKD
jgi:hypothetical protein